MAEKLTRVQRDIRDNPDKYDYADIPLPRKRTAAQEKLYADMRPQWAKDLAASK